MKERRTKQRNLCSDIVEIFWSNHLGWPSRTKAVLEDISPTGACLQIEIPVLVGTEVALRLGDLGFPGQVKYCTLIGGGYFVGLEFSSGQRWTKEEFDPEYILELPDEGEGEDDERATLETKELLKYGGNG